MIHLVEELGGELSADRFRAAFATQRASSFILDGGGATRLLARFAFMGAEPIATLRATRVRAGARAHARARVVITEREHERVLEDADPFEVLRGFLAKHAPPPEVLRERADVPFPFRAGAVGYIGYECGQILERLPCVQRPSIGMPDMAFGIYNWVIATCRETNRSWLSVLGATREEAKATRNRVLEALATPRPRRTTRKSGAEHPVHVQAQLDRDEYITRVLAAKEHITAGDAFEICLTNALRASFAQDDAWLLFRELRRSNPAPFAAFLDLPEGAIVSSSPERFLSLDITMDRRIAESRPIKGTRPRGATLADDAALAQDLATSEKDRAENAMIVDLVRNDLGRVCRFGTVDVPELFVVEPYATVHQLVSTVRGELEPDKDAIDLIRACFPPGSMTGAPKIEAMSILERLEPVERGVYAGALGWIDLGGAMDLSVVIRTAIVKDDTATFSVGGAIVADSNPITEYEETEHKARALVRAITTVVSNRARPPQEIELELPPTSCAP